MSASGCLDVLEAVASPFITAPVTLTPGKQVHSENILVEESTQTLLQFNLNDDSPMRYFTIEGSIQNKAKRARHGYSEYDSHKEGTIVSLREVAGDHLKDTHRPTQHGPFNYTPFCQSIPHSSSTSTSSFMVNRKKRKSWELDVACNPYQGGGYSPCLQASYTCNEPLQENLPGLEENQSSGYFGSLFSESVTDSWKEYCLSQEADPQATWYQKYLTDCLDFF